MNCKKIIIVLLLVTVVAGTLGAPFQAEAISISFGFQVVNDPMLIAETVFGWVSQAWRFVKDKIVKILLANLKKRLLDALVDATVDWIQNGGDPRFVTDFGGLFEDATQAAIGDTVQAIGQSDLCYPRQKLRLQLQLTQPVFSQRVSCTLDDIVGNVNDFINDFDRGGWVAYREIIKPQNNRWGLELLAQDELLRRKSEKRATAEYEASVGGGFLAQKRCLKWEFTVGEPFPVEGDSRYFFEDPAGNKYNGKAPQAPGSGWKCMESQTITPGLTIGESVTKAIGTDIDFLVGADDLTIYVAAIVDAMINRLTKETTMGLLGLFTGEDEGGARGTTESDCSDLNERAREACEKARESSEEDLGHYDQQQLEALLRGLSDLDNAENALLEARDTNNDLISTLNSLIACQTSRGITFDADAAAKIAEAGTRDGDINLLLSELPGLISELDALKADIETFKGDANEKIFLEIRINLLTLRVNAFAFKVSELVSTAQDLLDRAEASLNSCNGGSGGGGGGTPTCSDGIDNDVDGFTDYPAEFNNNPSNPDCASPNDSENRFDSVGGALAQCEDGVDNDGDGLADTNDPGCHTDNDAGNAASYNPNDNDETDVAPELPDVEFALSATGIDENVVGGATTFEIVLSFAASGVVTVDYDLLGNSTANLSSDCNSPDFCLPNNLPVATVTFPAGTTSQLITIGIYNDTFDENDETVKLQLISPSGANLGSPNRFTLTIIDDDGGLQGI